MGDFLEKVGNGTQDAAIPMGVVGLGAMATGLKNPARKYFGVISASAGLAAYEGGGIISMAGSASKSPCEEK